MSASFQVNEFVDNQKIGLFNINLLFWCCLAMFADGYDLNSIGYAMPFILEEWGLTANDMRLAASATLIGIFVGAPPLGYLGDRYGRKNSIIGGCMIYGAATLAIAWATTPNDIVLFRMLAGLGIGGIMPNTIALNSELAPKRYRATLIVLMFMGITMGSGTPGFVSIYLVADHGWEIIFLLGGILPILIGIILFFTLPESIKFLATRPARKTELICTARKMRPDLDIPDDATFINPPIVDGSAGSAKELFRGGLGVITPLLWLCFSTALMANFFINNWLPTLFSNFGIDNERAALITTWYHFGGTFGGLAIAILLDRFGYMIIAIMFACAVPAVALIGLEGLPDAGMTFFAASAGFAILGAQFGNNASAGLLYPTTVRSKGVGWALSIGRFGAIVGPYAGAQLLVMGLGMQAIFMVVTIPLVIGAIAAALLSRLCYKRFDGFQLDDTPVQELRLRDAETDPL